LAKSPQNGEEIIMKLLRIYDLRPWDPDLGCYLPIPKEEYHICDRCNRLHAKVYEVEDNDKKTYEIGAGCCRNHFDWEPTKAELKSARAQLKAEQGARRQERIEAAAKLAAESAIQNFPEVKTLKFEVKVLSDNNRPSIYLNDTVRLIDSEQLTPERLSERGHCLTTCYLNKAIHSAVEALGVGEKLRYEVRNRAYCLAAKAEKLHDLDRRILAALVAARDEGVFVTSHERAL
jgi:hypothetical protein